MVEQFGKRSLQPRGTRYARAETPMSSELVFHALVRPARLPDGVLALDRCVFQATDAVVHDLPLLLWDRPKRSGPEAWAPIRFRQVVQF